MHVPLLDLTLEHADVAEQLEAACARVLRSGRYILGPEVFAFEREVAEYLGASECVAVSSGTDALLCALSALEIGRGHEVITTGFSFIATAEAIVRVGATPVFADIDPESYNISVDSVRAAVTSRTRAVLAVHLYGRPAELVQLRQLCEEHGLYLIEDAAQAFGARTAHGAIGAAGTAVCFSFFPSKSLGAAGDGGLLALSDRELAARCRAIRAHGASAKHFHPWIGGNYRLDELQAAILRVKLRGFSAALERRRQLAREYTRRLASTPGLQTPAVGDGDGDGHSFCVYTLRVPTHRDELAEFLRACGIETAVHYPRPLTEQPALSAFAAPLPECERAAREVLSIPLYAALTPEQQAHVIESILRFFSSTLAPTGPRR